MNKEDDHKEKFKQALISTVKVISEDYRQDIAKKNASSKNLNFWDEVFPLFSDLTNDVYFFAGDIGAFPNGNELFYTKYLNVKFLATGMGGGMRDNFLIVSVIKGDVEIFFVPIN